MSSLLEIKFWNKRSSASNFMITAPHTLDNYFRSQLSRIRGGHLPVPIEFNNVVNNVQIFVKLVISLVCSMQKVKKNETFNFFRTFRTYPTKINKIC